jgi:orotate phosphoribosyltransferase
MFKTGTFGLHSGQISEIVDDVLTTGNSMEEARKNNV